MSRYAYPEIDGPQKSADFTEPLPAQALVQANSKARVTVHCKSVYSYHRLSYPAHTRSALERPDHKEG